LCPVLYRQNDRVWGGYEEGGGHALLSCFIFATLCCRGRLGPVRAGTPPVPLPKSVPADLWEILIPPDNGDRRSGARSAALP
jgi:hypothetical protein